jgi:hypothetical protein
MGGNGNGAVDLVSAFWSWRLQAACRGTDPYFGSEGERPDGRALRERRARNTASA